MLHAFFHRNNPYVMVGLLMVLLLLAIPIFMYPPLPTKTDVEWIVLGKLAAKHPIQALLYQDMPPLAIWASGLCYFLFGDALLPRQLLAFLLIGLQTVRFTFMILEKKILSERSFLASLAFGALFLYSFDALTLTPFLLGAVFLLMAINRIFHEISFSDLRQGLHLDLGFDVGIASLFVMSYSLFMIPVMICLAIFARASLRNVLLLLFGFALPHILFWVLFFVFDNEPYYLQSWEASWVHSFRLDRTGQWVIFLANGGGLLLFFSIVGLVGVSFNTATSVFTGQARKVMFIWLLFGAAITMTVEKLNVAGLAVCVPPVASFLSDYWVGSSNRRWARRGVTLFCIGIVVCLYTGRHFVSSYEQSTRVDTQKSILLPRQPVRLLALEDNWAIYWHNMPCSALTNWRVTQQIFSEPDYYHNIEIVNDLFEKDAPDLILDKQNYLCAFFKRLPASRARYWRKGSFWIRRGALAARDFF